MTCCDRLAGALKEDSEFYLVCFTFSPGQTIATCQRNMSQHCWAQHVACVWPPCCDVLGVVGSNLIIFKFEPTTPNMSQHIATRWPNACNMCAQQCCDVLHWHVAIVWPGLYFLMSALLFCFLGENMRWNANSTIPQVYLRISPALDNALSLVSCCSQHFSCPRSRFLYTSSFGGHAQ